MSTCRRGCCVEHFCAQGPLLRKPAGVHCGGADCVGTVHVIMRIVRSVMINSVQQPKKQSAPTAHNSHSHSIQLRTQFEGSSTLHPKQSLFQGSARRRVESVGAPKKHSWRLSGLQGRPSHLFHDQAPAAVCLCNGAARKLRPIEQPWICTTV